MRWLINDRDGNPIYLTRERWQHITDIFNHPEMRDFEEHLKTTIKKGRRRQEPLNPRKYRYVYHFSDLPGENNHIVAIVIFALNIDNKGKTNPNNFVATVFLKHIQLKGDKK